MVASSNASVPTYTSKPDLDRIQIPAQRLDRLERLEEVDLPTAQVTLHAA